MANNFDKKLGILYLRDYLMKETDYTHMVTVPDMMKMLQSHEITSDRRTIYSDLVTLGENYGMDLRREGNSYFVGRKDFDLEELRILIDMVQSSNFITKSKSEKLIGKLKNQASSYEAKSFGKTIYIQSRIKNSNESVYINVNRISDAIAMNREIQFKYFHYNVKKQKELSHDGKIYEISPFALIWADRNYYLLGYSAEHNEMRHYRVDRMKALEISEIARQGRELFEKTDISTYSKGVFYMFTGEKTQVTLRCRNYVADSVIDRFGEDTMIIKDGDEYFTFTEKIVVSPQFFSWISAFGKDIEILRPANVRKEFKNHLSEMLELYND